jgi:hypothetical protein
VYAGGGRWWRRLEDIVVVVEAGWLGLGWLQVGGSGEGKPVQAGAVIKAGNIPDWRNLISGRLLWQSHPYSYVVLLRCRAPISLNGEQLVLHATKSFLNLDHSIHEHTAPIPRFSRRIGARFGLAARSTWRADGRGRRSGKDMFPSLARGAAEVITRSHRHRRLPYTGGGIAFQQSC